MEDMETGSTKRIIEVNGVKLEVDLRNAVRVDTFRIGTRVRVLVKTYSGYNVHHGVIVGFEPFQKQPTIIIAYMEIGGSDALVKFVNYNAKTEDVEIVPSIDDEKLDKKRVEELFAKQEAKLERDLQDLRDRREYFERVFGENWKTIGTDEEREIA